MRYPRRILLIAALLAVEPALAQSVLLDGSTCSFLDPNCIPKTPPKDPPGSTSTEGDPDRFDLRKLKESDKETLEQLEIQGGALIKDGGIYQ